MEEGTVPPALKEALVCFLLHKSSLDTAVLDNFHPVSNFLFLQKVVEKVVVYSFKWIILIHWSGFRMGHNIKVALIVVMDDLLQAQDESGTLPSWPYLIHHQLLIPLIMVSLESAEGIWNGKQFFNGSLHHPRLFQSVLIGRGEI